MDEKIELAVAKVIGCDTEELREEKYDMYGLRVFSAYGQEWAIGDDDEAKEACEKYILDTIWAFNADFVASHTKAGVTNGMVRVIQAMQKDCEGCNEDVKSLIEDLDTFVQDAISADGRGTFLSSYDSNEVEINLDGEDFYAYRIN